MITEPLTVAEAMASEHAEEWRAAMDEEIGNLARFKLFRTCSAVRGSPAWAIGEVEMGLQGEIRI